MEQYKTYLYTFKRASGLKLEIIARRDETAMEIIAIENQLNLAPWKPKKWKFKKEIYITKEPYPLEQNEIKVAEKRLEHRTAKIINGLAERG